MIFSDLREIALAVGVLDVAEEIGAFTDEVVAAPEEVAGGAHLLGVDVDLGEHTSMSINAFEQTDRASFGPCCRMARARPARCSTLTSASLLFEGLTNLAV